MWCLQQFLNSIDIWCAHASCRYLHENVQEIGSEICICTVWRQVGVISRVNLSQNVQSLSTVTCRIVCIRGIKHAINFHRSLCRVYLSFECPWTVSLPLVTCHALYLQIWVSVAAVSVLEFLFSLTYETILMNCHCNSYVNSKIILQINLIEIEVQEGRGQTHQCHVMNRTVVSIEL
jgi:hypothetical protein